MIQKFLWLLICCLPVSGFAQSTWQQEVNYKINVTLNDNLHTLTASEEVEYSNHSPDALSFIYFHLWPNAYKNQETALAKQLLRNNETDFYFSKPEEKGYINGLDFKVNGKPVTVEPDPHHPDICKLILPNPLQPGERILISTPFTVKLPGSFSRLGHVGQSYQITQWFPKPAVYDHKGWHPMPYLDQGEFYSEFGKFEVHITLPANYTVGATGVLQNPEERERLNALAAATAAKTSFGSDLSFPASSTETKTLHYVQDNIHDFAWFADKRFNVLKSEVVLPQSQRTVTTWLMFLNKNTDAWVKSIKAINEAVTYYSKWVGEYPYEHATAVDGALSAGSGMEYPMVTVTGPEAIVHEVGHNWFYGILASNERDYAWMDEGINSYYEFRLGELENPDYSQLDPLVKNSRLRKTFNLENLHGNALNILPYQMVASRGLDQPLQYPSEAFSSSNYGSIVYMKTAILFKYLASFLGQEKFDAAMQAYFNTWKFRHPYPEDLQAVLEKVSDQKLDWFFRNLVQTNVRIDAGVSKVSTENNSLQVTITNHSTTPAPIPVAALDANGQVLELKWTSPLENEEQIRFENASTADRIVIDPEHVLPEINRSNNQIKVNRRFGKWEKLKPQVLAGIEQADRKQLYYLPVIGANTYDKFMVGLAVSNSTLIQKKVNYVAVPMYSFGQNKLNGYASINWNLLSKKYAKSTVLNFSAARFERFTKYEPSFTFNLPKIAGYSPESKLKFASTHVSINDRVEVNGSDAYFDYQFAYTIPSVEYSIISKNAIRRFMAVTSVELFIVNQSFFGQDKKPVSGKITLEYDQQYIKGKYFKARLFAGKFFGDKPTEPGYTLFQMGLSGSQDYRKETIFLDRSQRSNALTAFIRQTDNRDGGFKNYLPVFSDRWLSTLNLSMDLPVTPLSVYADAGVASFTQIPPNIGGPLPSGVQTRFYYGSGLSIRSGKLLQLYFPVTGSNYQHHVPKSINDFTRNIRFSLNLAAYNPFRLLTDVLK